MSKISRAECPFKVMHVGHASFTIGAEAADVKRVTVQLKGDDGVALQSVGHVRCHLTSDAAGLTPGTAPTTLAIGTKGLILLEDVANHYFSVKSAADGIFNIDIGVTGAATYYLVILLPDGSQVVSGAITFV